MKEIDEKGIIETLKKEREDLSKKAFELNVEIKAKEEQRGRLQFDMAKKQGAIEDFERLVLGIKPKDKVVSEKPIEPKEQPPT